MSTNITKKPVYKTLDFFVSTGSLGQLQFTTNPAAAQTITLNGAAFTFVSGAPGGLQAQVGATLAATLVNLAAALNASANPNVSKNAYWQDGTNLNFINRTLGASGNTFTVATNVTGATSLTGATMGFGGAWNGICMTTGQLVFSNVAAKPGDACGSWARSQNYSDSAWLNITETIIGGSRTVGRGIYEGLSENGFYYSGNG